MSSVLFIACDHNVTLTGLTAGGSYLNAATVTYALKTGLGVTVTGGTGTMTYTAASNGNYTGTIESTVTTLLSEGAGYRLEVTISQGNNDDFRVLQFTARYRDAT